MGCFRNQLNMEHGGQLRGVLGFRQLMRNSMESILLGPSQDPGLVPWRVPDSQSLSSVAPTYSAFGPRGICIMTSLRTVAISSTLAILEAKYLRTKG